MRKGVQACNFIKKEALTQVLSCEFCKIFQNTFMEQLWWLLTKTRNFWRKACFSLPHSPIARGTFKTKFVIRNSFGFKLFHWIHGFIANSTFIGCISCTKFLGDPSCFPFVDLEVKITIKYKSNSWFTKKEGKQSFANGSF